MFKRLMKALKKANVISLKGNAVEIVFMEEDEAKDFFESLDTLQMTPVTE